MSAAQAGHALQNLPRSSTKAKHKPLTQALPRLPGPRPLAGASRVPGSPPCSRPQALSKPLRGNRCTDRAGAGGGGAQPGPCDLLLLYLRLEMLIALS